MSTPMALLAQGTFVSDAVARLVELPSTVDYFVIRNRSIWGSNPADLVVESTWYRGYANGQATTISEANTGVMSATLIAAAGAGFTEIDRTSLAPGPLVATGTAITNATPGVVTDATSPAVGDVVRMMNTTAMLQIAGLEFTVTAVNPGVTFTLGYMIGAGYAAAATNADYRILPQSRYFPRRAWIQNITAAAAAVISTSTAHGYAVGSRITVNNPDANFGMVQIDGLSGTVTAVTANTITTDINSAAFGAFAYPTSAVAATGITHPHVVPFGEVSTILTEATDNTPLSGMFLDTGVVGANTDVMDWQAFGRDYTI